MAISPRKATRRGIAARRQLRAQGLRPVEIWVPDTRSPAFRQEARRQSALVAHAPDADDVMDFIEANQDPGG